MKDIITQSRSNANRKLNAKLKQEGQIVKPGRRRLDVLPPFESTTKTSIPVAPSPAHFERLPPKTERVLHLLKEQPCLDSRIHSKTLAEQFTLAGSLSPGTLTGLLSSPFKKKENNVSQTAPRQRSKNLDHSSSPTRLLSQFRQNTSKTPVINGTLFPAQ